MSCDAALVLNVLPSQNEHNDVLVGVGFFLEGSGVDIAYKHEINGPGRLLALTIKYHVAPQ